MKTNESKTPYELESLGWKITQIGSPDWYTGGQHDYNVFHSFNFPFGKEMKNTNLKTVLEFITNFIKEDQQKQEIERFNLDR